MDVEGLRKRIPTVDMMTYLNTGWSGPSPVSVVEAITARLEYESYNGPTSAEVMESGEKIRSEAKEALASLINADAQEILLTQSTTDGLNAVMSGLPWREGDEIITCDLEHPSILIPCYHLQDRYGVKVRVLPVAPDEPEDLILSRIEGALTDRTRMVFLSHIEYSSGLRMPVKQIGGLVGPRGIWYLLDGAQGPGHVAVDVREIGCDFYSLPGQKWLLGPDQTGALYIRREIIPLVIPVHVAGSAVLDYDLEGGYSPNSDDIDKFRVGTTSAPLRAGFVEGIRFVQGVGIDRIEQRNLALAATLKVRLSGVSGVRVLSPMEGPGSSGLVSFEVEGVDSTRVAEALWKNDRILVRAVSYPPAVRASLDFFNTEQEVAQLAEVVRIVTPHL